MAGRRPEFRPCQGYGDPTAWPSVVSQPISPHSALFHLFPCTPHPSCSPELLGRAQGATSSSWGPRHSRVFFVSRTSRKKRRLSTRSTRCRRPRRSARCLHPTCLLSSESAVLTSLSPALNPKPVGYPRAPTPRQEVPCEHSSEHGNLSSQRVRSD